MMNSHKEWMAHISELDEFFGNEPRYPLTTMEVYVNKQFDRQNEILKNTSSEISDGIIEATNVICGTLENGFNSLIETNQKGFNDLSNKLDEIASILDWGFDRLIEQQQITNLLLTNVTELLRIPDSQKQRQYYIEQGLKFFTNARFNRELYNDALDNFLLAEKIEKTDYFLLQKIGLVYLFSHKHLDFQKAYEYFDKSTKYAYPESFLQSKQTKNVLSLDASIDFKEQINSYLDVNEITAKSLLLGARALFFLKKYDQALSNINKAIKLKPKSSAQYFYDKAIYESLNGNNEHMVEALKESIKMKPSYANAILYDKRLIKNKLVIQLLKRISRVKNKEFDDILNNVKNNFSSNTVFSKKIKKINQLHKNKTFLSSVAGIKILTDNIINTDDNLKKLISKEYYIRDKIKNFDKMSSNNELKSKVEKLNNNISTLSDSLLGNNTELVNYFKVFKYENIIDKLEIDIPKLIDSYWTYKRNHWRLKNRIWNVILTIIGIIPIIFILYLLLFIHSFWSITGGLILLAIVLFKWYDWGIFDALDHSINYNKYKETVDNSNKTIMNLEKKILEYIS